MPLDADYHVDHSPEAEEYSGWSIIEVEKGNALPKTQMRIRRRFNLITPCLSIVLLACLPAAAGDASITPKPPMAWKNMGNQEKGGP